MNKKNQKSILVLLFLATIFLLSQKAFCRISAGLCPKVEYETIIKSPIEYHDYLGKWYEIIRDKSVIFQNGTCASAYYCLNKDGFINVFNQELRGRTLIKANGEARLTKDYNRLTVSFAGGHWKDYDKGEYRIINTDFKNYSVVYSCKQKDEKNKIELVWVLARDPKKISEDILKSWINYLDTKFSYKSEELIVTKHDTSKCMLVDARDKKIKRDILC